MKEELYYCFLFLVFLLGSYLWFRVVSHAVFLSFFRLLDERVQEITMKKVKVDRRKENEEERVA